MAILRSQQSALRPVVMEESDSHAVPSLCTTFPTRFARTRKLLRCSRQRRAEQHLCPPPRIQPLGFPIQVLLCPLENPECNRTKMCSFGFDRDQRSKSGVCDIRLQGHAQESNRGFNQRNCASERVLSPPPPFATLFGILTVRGTNKEFPSAFQRRDVSTQNFGNGRVGVHTVRPSSPNARNGTSSFFSALRGGRARTATTMAAIFWLSPR